MPSRMFLLTGFLLVLAPLAAGSDLSAAPPTKKAPPKKSPKGKLEKGAAVDGAWSQFLGPERDNHSPETGLLATWPAGGPRLIGTVTGLGVGISNISIADGVFYTMGNLGQRETVLAFSLDTGKSVWSFNNAPAFHNSFGDGPRGTPTIDGDKLYALGAGGDLACLDRQKGSRVWQGNILKEFGGSLPNWGICESVLIDDDHLICTPGGNGATMVALNKKTGKTVWKAAVPQGDRAAYSSPIAVTVGGVKQFVQFTSNGTIGIRASDGKFLWRDNSAANGTANCCSPVAGGDMVFSASGYGTGGSMVQLTSASNETSARFGWHSNDMQVQHGGMVVVDGYVYAANEQAVVCVELKSGNVKWKDRSVGKGSVTYADGKLFVRSENGPVAMIEASPAGYNELGRFDQPNRTGSKAWTYPVVTGGKLFLRDQDTLLAYDIKGK